MATVEAFRAMGVDIDQPEDLAALVETMLLLPNNAAVSELLVCSQYEPML